MGAGRRCFPWGSGVFPWRRRPDGVKGRDEGGVELAGVVKEVVEVDERFGDVELEDVMPGRGEFVVVGEGGHGGEGIVEDGVVAWRDLACADVEDERHEGRVIAGKSHEHSEASPRLPLGDGLAICNVVVEHVDRATEDVGAGEVVVGETVACPEF